MKSLDMKSKEPGMFLCRALLSLIVVLMIGFVGLGVRAFATADTTQFIFSAVFVISVAIRVLYFMLRRPIRELTAHSLFREPPFLKLFLLPRLRTIRGNPLTLNHPSERRSRDDLVVIKTAGGSLTASP
jgi:ABC-type Na+ efflux pump permease subunit